MNSLFSDRRNTITGSNRQSYTYTMPKRIILIRHGETEVNEDEEVLEFVPNYKISLSSKGIEQAKTVGSKIHEVMSESGENWKALCYVSPSERTKQTMERIVGENFPEGKVMGLKEECRLREQHFGNFQEMEKRKKIKRIRNRYGKFFYRVPDGESSADVYDRVSGFIETVRREMETNKLNSNNPSDEVNLIIVSHGLTILLFLMKWFNWTVDQFEGLTNPKNCEYRVLQLGCNGEYSLATHHKVEELRAWGLSEDMIEDQICWAYGSKNNLNSSNVLGKSDVYSEDEENSDEFLEESGSKSKRQLAYVDHHKA